MKIKIADINININGDMNQFFIDRMQNYIVNSDDNNNKIEINFAICDYIEKPTGKVIATKADRTWIYDENGDFCYFDYNDHFKKCVFTTTIRKYNIDNSEQLQNHKVAVDIKFYNYHTKEEFEFLNNALRDKKKNEPNPKNREHTDITDFEYGLLNSTDQCLWFALLYFNAIVIHSSAINYNGDGIIFSAPSGTGKTTHTDLWKKKYPQVEIVNDDSPIIRFDNDEQNTPLLCGSPWAGASGVNTNKIVPLKAIVFLEQSPTDIIEKLSPIVALTKLLNEIQKPMDKDLMDKTFDLINILLTNVPCYLLKCTPTEKAVETVWYELYNQATIDI